MPGKVILSALKQSLQTHLHNPILNCNINIIKGNGSQHIHLIALHIQTKVINLGHVQGPEHSKERKANNIGESASLCYVVIRVGSHHLAQVEGLSICNMHGLPR